VKLDVRSIEWNQWRFLEWSGTPVSFVGKQGAVVTIGGGAKRTVARSFHLPGDKDVQWMRRMCFSP
jgi:hypothetical protein